MKPSVLSMTASKWNTAWSEFMPAHPTQETTSPPTWKIVIPEGIGPPVKMGGNCPELDYLTCNHTASLAGRAIEMRLTVEGDADMYLDYFTEEGNNPPSGASPPSAHILIYRDMSSEFGRWWSTVRVDLSPGSDGNIVVPLLPENFSSVFGKVGSQDATTIKAFNYAISNPRQVGMTFGGGYFYSHGLVARNGPATIHCPSYKII